MLMPPRSGFLLTNMLRSQAISPTGWNQALEFARSNPPSLLLLDPPYPNYSAKRLKDRAESYKPLEDLFDLWNMVTPIRQLLDCASKTGSGHGVLVGCWITNHAKVQRFVLTKLFPAWGLTHVGQLVWVKVTAGDESRSIPGGQLVFPSNNKQGRKPYEILLLASTKPTMKRAVEVETRLFASVPLGHSRKPAVFPLLRDYLPSSSACNVYEVFARTLVSGPTSSSCWINVGNEPFAFNQEGVGYA
ncbi:hypothetical protein CBS101457_003835 [Exobasidium rhododendri]|nr:hypothetical protein CBS101457_003835 [Exobasidium rhododendri]